MGRLLSGVEVNLVIRLHLIRMMRKKKAKQTER
jgi:hypothetical protein